jgi:hypothetical protein
MPTINQLALLSTPNSGDQIPVYSPNNGDARRMSIGALLQLFQQQFASPTMATNVYTPGTGSSLRARWPPAQ